MMEFDNCKSPLIGVEYVVSFESNSFDYLVCILCNKKGNAGNILNHLKCQKHRLHFLREHFPIIAKELTCNLFDVKESSCFVSHLVEKAFGRRKITIYDDEYSGNSRAKNQIFLKNSVFYAEEDLNVVRLVNFLHDYKDNKYSSKNKIRDFVNINKVDKPEKETKTPNYRISLKFEYDTLNIKYNYYIKYPMNHPEYAAELSIHMLKKLPKDYNISGKSPKIYNSTADWKKHWETIMDKLFTQEALYMKKELKQQLNLSSNKEQNPSPVIIKQKPVRETTRSKHKIICNKELEPIPVKRLKISKDTIAKVLDVEKLPEQDRPKTLLSICKQLKSYVLGDLSVKINNLFDEASKIGDGKNMDALQDYRNVKLLKDVKLILIDQTSDGWLPVTKTNEMKQVIEDITTLLKKVTNKQPKTKKPFEFLSEDEVKTLVLNYSELTSEDQNNLVNYLEIMKVKNNKLYNKITTIIQQDITLSDNNESSFVVDEVNDVSIVISDDEDDYDLTEVVSKAKQIVEENFCVSELEIPTFELSSDEN